MSTHYLKHNDYLGSVENDLENEILYGKILFINDTITYEGTTITELKTAFVESVKDYLTTCDELGRAPQKAFKGTFNIRVGEEIHREATLHAFRKGQNLNEFVKEAVEEKISAITKEKAPAKIHITFQEISPQKSEPVEQVTEKFSITKRVFPSLGGPPEDINTSIH